MKKTIALIFLALMALGLILSVTGCADVSHVQNCLPPLEHTYGFWGGVWHGMIAQFSFVGSLFSDEIAIYAINNNGAWYNFGYVGGLGIMIRIIAWVVKFIKES